MIYVLRLRVGIEEDRFQPNRIMHNKLNILILLNFLCFPVFKTYSQNFPDEIKIIGKIYGQVVNKNNGNPVEFASVALYSLADTNTVFGTITNVNGDYAIKEIPLGIYNLEISFIGFKKTRINNVFIRPKENEIFFGKVELEPVFFNLDEVSITAEKSQFEYKVDKKVINIDQDIIVKGGSVVEALENMPSIKTDMEGNLTLRGSSNYKVLINGRPSVLQGSDALQQIPANTVKSVEIITNPSAKFNPEGEVGIINVITKKSLSEGFSGILNGSLGSLGKYGSEAILGYSIRKFAINGSFNISENPIKGNALRYTETDTDDNFLSRDSDGGMSISRQLLNTSLGLNYTPNERNYFNVETNLGKQTFKRNSYSEIISNTDSIAYILADSDDKKITQFISASFDYQHLFNLSGHKLDASIFYSSSAIDQKNLLIEDFSDINWQFQSSSIQQYSFQDGVNTELQLNIDYVKPFDNSNKLELGYQGNINGNYLNQNFELYETHSENYLKNTGEIEITKYTQAFYSLYSGKFHNFSYKIGLRTESNQKQIIQKTEDSSFSYENLDLFPSFHFSYSQNRRNQMQLSYSRRLNTPTIARLNPYTDYIDNKTYRQGNPNLEPEFINSFEVNYARRFFMSFISAELFYRETVNKITPVWAPQDDGSLLISYENFDKDNSIGLEFMASLNLIEWWSIMLSTSLYQYNIQGDELGYDINNSSNSLNARLSSRFKIKKTSTQLQINGIYNGAKASVQGSRDSFFITVLGINQNIIKNKLSATFQIRDIFNTMKFDTYHESEYYINSLTFTPSTPFVSFSLSFKFNNYKKPSRQLGNINEFDFEETIY